MLPILILLGTRRPFQVLWMRSVRSAGEVKYRLLPQSELPWTTRVTGRNEITMCDPWVNHFCQHVADISILSAVKFILFIYSVKMYLFINFFCALKTTLRHKSHCCYYLARHCKWSLAKKNKYIVMPQQMDKNILWIFFFSFLQTCCHYDRRVKSSI